MRLRRRNMHVRQTALFPKLMFPAPHFSADISASDVRNWITQLPRNTQISLYIHIPFCRRLCWFCACRTQGLPNPSPLAGYIERLEKELALIKSSLPKGVSLGHLHLGGGTPTILNAGQVKSLMTNVFDTLPLSKNAEISIEIDPTEVDEDRVVALAEIGMTRASIGIQDFDPDIQAALLCQFQVSVSDICDNHDMQPTALSDRFEQVNTRFENLLNVTETGLIIPPEARPLTRMIAREFDTYSLSDTGHS